MVGRPNKIKGFLLFVGFIIPTKIFLYTPLRTDHKICYNVRVLSKEENSDVVSGPWLTDRGTTKVDSTERGTTS